MVQNLFILGTSYAQIIIHTGVAIAAKFVGCKDDGQSPLKKYIINFAGACITLIAPIVGLVRMRKAGENAFGLTGVALLAPMLFFGVNFVFALTDLINFAIHGV